ncbi:coiled-coil domain-containing protein 93 isoform X2 [Euwallacea fornicatus]|uniref:coiled-coil domain-containing protein 93 isoform X2 n=1 Tax=Euwallacea fornicatus TaxID=995702 RepID=UPI00338E2E08
MAYVNQELLQKFQKASLADKRQEGDGLETKIDIREDEEQSLKLQEIIDLLVAAGYFRARIKGLSPFDKVVGGMTWCIELLDVDVDVDLLFQENSTIGQQIALSEKIVAVLPKIKCPHSIEPHQIQGLDFIHIFPVIQWLVKSSMEARQEKAAFVQSYALYQYEKEFPTKNEDEDKQQGIAKNINVVKEHYRPHRYYKRKNVPPPDILSRVQITLLEYGFRGDQTSKSGPPTRENSEQIEQPSNSTEEEDVKMSDQEVLQDIKLTDQDKQILVKHYKTLQSELKDGGAQSIEDQQLALLERQYLFLNDSIARLSEKQQHVQEQIETETKLLADVKIKQSVIDETLREFEQEDIKNHSTVKEIEELVILNDSLKAKEAAFKENCRKELAKLQKEIGEFKEMLSPVELTPEQLEQIEAFTEKLASIRLELAKKNQIVAKLQRQLDDIPNRAEMAQYQRRFLELYNQVAAKHKETKQYYTLYNTLEDNKRYMQKELSLLNSVAENYPTAMESFSGKEDFLKQLHNIVEGLKQNRHKIEKQVSEEKRKRDVMAANFQSLLELQRAYASAVKQLSLECRNYETLLARKGNDA